MMLSHWHTAISSIGQGCVDAGIIDEDVDTAEAGKDSAHRLLNRLLIAHVKS